MPSVSRSQRRLFAIAEHHPDQLHTPNRGLLRLSHQQLHDFAATSTRDLPEYKGDKRDARKFLGRPHRGARA